MSQDVYGTLPVEQAKKQITLNKKTHTHSRDTLRGRYNPFYTQEPKTYDNPWDAPVWRKWQGRADQFWSARLQPNIIWESFKNGDLVNTNNGSI